MGTTGTTTNDPSTSTTWQMTHHLPPALWAVAQWRHTTHPQPHKQLLVGWVVGGTTTMSKQQGRTMRATGHPHLRATARRMDDGCGLLWQRVWVKRGGRPPLNDTAPTPRLQALRVLNVVKTCSLSFQKIVWFLIHWFIILTAAKYFPNRLK
jgi:hypothetical protein